MELNNKNLRYTLSTIGRSFDKAHVFNNRIHLVSSIFYTNNFNIDSDSIFKSDVYIIRVIPISADLFEIIEHNSTCTEFIFSISYLLRSMKSSNVSLDSFIEVLIGNHYQKEKENNMLISKLLFVYENLSWSNIRILLNGFNIDYSGGSISNRHLLSTVQYKLSSILIDMGYTVTDVYNSFVVTSKLIRFNESEELKNLDKNSNFNLRLQILELENLIKLNIEKCKTEINDLNKDVNSREGTISSLQKDLLQRLESKSKSNKVLTTTRISNIKTNIKYATKKIETIKIEILKIQTKISELKLELSTLNNLSPSDLQDKYLKLIQNVRRGNDIYKFKSLVNRKLRVVKILDRREYCTFSKTKNLIVNNLLLFNNTFRLSSSIITPLTLNHPA